MSGPPYSLDITPEEVEVLEPEVEEWVEPEPEEVGEYHSNKAPRDLRPLIMYSSLDEDCESEVRVRRSIHAAPRVQRSVSQADFKLVCFNPVSLNPLPRHQKCLSVYTLLLCACVRCLFSFQSPVNSSAIFENV